MPDLKKGSASAQFIKKNQEGVLDEDEQGVDIIPDESRRDFPRDAIFLSTSAEPWLRNDSSSNYNRPGKGFREMAMTLGTGRK